MIIRHIIKLQLRRKLYYKLFSLLLKQLKQANTKYILFNGITSKPVSK